MFRQQLYHKRILCQWPQIILSQFAFYCATDALSYCKLLPSWKEKQLNHTFRLKYSDDNIDPNLVDKLVRLTNRKRLDEYLNKILVPRPVGSPNHKKVATFISDQLTALNYNVENHQFEQSTCIGNQYFRNIIATLNPLSPRRLVLACHYESKMMLEFVGAIDSAVPCALMLDVAETLSTFFTTLKPDLDVTLQLIFFDGEEAFIQWSEDDSLYGSKKLADDWHSKRYPSHPLLQSKASELDRIDAMILLDLLGSSKSGTRIPNYRYTNFLPLYYALAGIEERLIKNGQMKGGRFSMFYGEAYGGIEDDHIPFIQKNVNVVHVIPSPFPYVWHTTKDTRENLDMATVEDWSSILRVFVAWYFQH